jgi:hypothetical protein
MFGNKAGAPPGGGGTAARQLHPPKIEIKKTHFVGAMTWNVLRDLPFSRNDPLKWGDD